ncbi:RNA polymerase II degradation factor 1 [Drosophila hydei]|uniref:RNA polymerase II degradation factor 1 n=1 Tax=Drosophila hydei TaxID=7224 RepID=A0A6J2SUI4_DROHY|nr:RNA polymerase II degradation factor 1 [Drosophila hydei]
MYPQAELENYKLQVELLQEKLRRSEDNRQQLEHKLDKVLQKRSEIEKGVRHKTRQKYQEFLEEQTQRNERNKKLVQMLERIDEQTAVMSQRSERLKMMKLQYQMYFAKLVQSQTLRCIQQTTAPGGNAMPIPVLIQPQSTAVSSPAVVTAPANAAPAPIANQSQPLMIPLTTAPPQQWAFAMATPTPTPTQAGMLLTSQVTPQPVYVPYPDLYGGAGVGLGVGQPLTTSNLFDLRATLRALDNENADLPERMTHFDESRSGNTDRAAPAKTASMMTTMTTTATTTTTTISTPCSAKDMSARELSSTSSTLATSSLTFDKLPMTAALAEVPAAAVAAGIDDVGGRPQAAAPLRRNSRQELEQDAWPNSRVTKGEHEKSPSVVSYNEPSGQQQQPQQRQQQQHNFDAYFGELKIDEPWHPAAAPIATMTRPKDQYEDKTDLSVRAGKMKTVGGDGAIGGLVGGISNDLLDEVKASRAALEKAAAAVDEQLARGNQLSPPAANEPFAKPGVSIENIENAIYGERLTATNTAMSARAGAAAAAAAAAVAATAATAATAVAAAAATTTTAAPAKGLVENLVSNASQPQPHQQEQQQEEEQVTPVDIQQLPEQQQQQRPAEIAFGQYEANSYVDPGEPSYASIESTPQQQLQQSASVAGEPLYSEIGNPTDYQQYATDVANATAEAEADAAVAAAQQEYSGMDYGNYDAAQYAAGYDPNAYPGYIYDEATGQYIADPNATQYAPDGSYAGQDYDAAAANYDYYSEQQQQQQQQQPQPQQQEQQQEQQQVAYPMSDNNNGAAAELVSPQEVEQAPPHDGADAKPEAIHPPAVAGSAAKPARPTSILASTDKQAMPNDAHQQQQQQQKKKKRVNFVDSSETDDSSSAKPVQEPTGITASPATTTPAGAAASESDFDFSTGSEAKN